VSVKAGLKTRIRVSRGPVFLPPVVVVADGIVVGDERRDILKIDTKTLRTLWKVRSNGFKPLRTTAGGIVLVSWQEGVWQVVDGNSGRSLWMLEAGTPEGSWWGDRALLGKNPIRVLDLNARKIVEQFEVPGGPFSLAVPIGTVLLGEGMLARDMTGGDPIRAFDLIERRLLWSKDLISEAETLLGREGRIPLFTLVAGGEGRFLVTRNKTVLSYALIDATLLWHQPFEVPYYYPDVRDDRIYAWIYRADFASHLVALHEPTGRVIYDLPLARHGGPFAEIQQPRQAGLGEEHIVFTTRSGLIAVFRLADGELVWSYEHDDEIYQPVVSGNRIYITASSGELLVFEVERTL
jgi:outer membrane protein assembly factor BamB